MSMKKKKKPLKRITLKQLKTYFGEDFVEPKAEEYGSLPPVGVEEVLEYLDTKISPSSPKHVLRAIKSQLDDLKKQVIRLEKQLAHL
jgi:hypothetical protein